VRLSDESDESDISDDSPGGSYTAFCKLIDLEDRSGIEIKGVVIKEVCLVVITGGGGTAAFF